MPWAKPGITAHTGAVGRTVGQAPPAGHGAGACQCWPGWLQPVWPARACCPGSPCLCVGGSPGAVCAACGTTASTDCTAADRTARPGSSAACRCRPGPGTAAALHRRICPADAVVATAEDSQPIVIRAVGDVVLGSDYPEHRLPTAADRQRITALRRELRQPMWWWQPGGRAVDTGASRKDASKPGLYTFRMPTSYALTLRDMGFDVMSLANNHSMDFRCAGLASTLAALRANGIAPMGVPGAEVATVTVRRTRVAFSTSGYLPAFVRMDDARRITATSGTPAPVPTGWW